MSKSKKDTRAGGKFCRSHGTCVHAATIVADIADRCKDVTKIRLGYITSGTGSAGGLRRVKITVERKSLLLEVRDNTSIQEIWVYVSDLEAAKSALINGILAKGFGVSFKNVPH